MQVRMTSSSESGDVGIDVRGRIHVVDDDDQVRVAMVRLLASAGYAVLGHRSAESFLADCDSGEHGCVVLDMRLTGTSGLEIQRQLVEAGRDLPIIFISSVRSRTVPPSVTSSPEDARYRESPKAAVADCPYPAE